MVQWNIATKSLWTYFKYKILKREMDPSYMVGI